MKNIILTGGGSAGHVTPNLALLPALAAEGFAPVYVGSKNGIEKGLAEGADIPYYPISTGKLRRDKLISLQNISDAPRVLKGVFDAMGVIKKVKPSVIFSKGGFVGLPVAVAGKLCGVPVILHESDMTPGLANKLSISFASAVCATFPETLERLPKDKAVLTGNPIRAGLFTGDRARGLEICGFTGNKPVIMVMGGSLGSTKVNGFLREALPSLLQAFNVAHICGKDNISEALIHTPGYAQFEYLREELPHVFAACDAVISRAGSNTINELLALRKPSLLIPLGNRATRGDQVQNAESFEKRGFATLLYEHDLTAEALSAAVSSLYANRLDFIARMEEIPSGDAVSQVIGVIKRFA